MGRNKGFRKRADLTTFLDEDRASDEPEDCEPEDVLREELEELLLLPLLVVGFRDGTLSCAVALKPRNPVRFETR